MGILYGVGVNDRNLCGPGSYKASEGVWAMYPEYQMWKGLINRCFSEKEKIRRSACSDSMCCPEWVHRKAFQDWYYSHSHHNDNSGTTLQIDKDILFINNQLYSPHTTVLVPQYVNLSVRKLAKGDTPWVAKVQKGARMINEFKRPWRYDVRCGDENYSKCSFVTKLDAHMAAQLIKIDYLHGIIDRYRKEACYDPRVEQGVMNRIQILQKANTKGRVCRI